MTTKTWRLLAAMAIATLSPRAMAATWTQADPLTQATAMVQDARHDMTEDPAQAERRASAFEASIRSLPATNARKTAAAKALWVMGEASTRQRHAPRAKALLDRALALASETGDIQTIADVTASQAGLDNDTGMLGEAVQKYQAAFSAYERLGNRRSQSITLQNLGSLYMHANDPARAARYIRQAAAVYPDEPALLSTMQNTLGNIYAANGNKAAAEREFARGAEMARRAGLPKTETLLLNNRVRTLIDMHRPSEAIALDGRLRALVAQGVEPDNYYVAIQAVLAGARGSRTKARSLADVLSARLRGEDPMLGDYDLHQLLYETYKSVGADAEALRQLELADAIQSRTTSATLSAQNALLGAEFDYANQNLRRAGLQGDKMRQSVADGRRTLMWMTITAATILIGMALGLNASFRVRRRIGRSNVELQNALDEVVLRERAERQAIQLAEHDVLTGLPNRRHLMGNLLLGVVDDGDEATQVAIMLLDLDRFKPINDIHGHEIGDLLLAEVADRLRTLCATRRAKVVRLGGDEFVIVSAISDDEDGTAFAAETVARINAPFDVEGRRLTVGVSIGVAVHSRDGTQVSDLLRKADISMYEAKRQGRNGYRFFDEQMDVRLRERAQTEADLHMAVQEEMIDVHYQPIHSFETGRTSSFEALARWTHPLRGPVPPDEFIPIAEDVGLIGRITDQVLRQTCRTAREWPADVSASVNLSPILLGDEWIAPRILGILAEEGLAPHRLIIEITENAVISDVRHAAEVIASLRASGIRVALDDFGKGHSSLSQLHELAFDYLKLDCSFVRTLDNPHSMKISTAVAGMAKAMELPVTAEGIENLEAADTLKAMGFTYGQGYHYGRPMTAPQAREMAWTTGDAANRKVA